MDFTNLINVDVDKRTSESIKQISRSERNNSLYLERNDHGTKRPDTLSGISRQLGSSRVVGSCRVFSSSLLSLSEFCVLVFFVVFFFMYRKSRAMLVLAYLL